MRRRRFLRLLAAGAAVSSAPWGGRSGAADGALECVVVGGGVAGLTAAWALGDRRVLLLEAGERFGGRAVSGRHGGWDYAKGAEYLGEPEGIFARMIAELGLELVEIPTPMDMLYRDGRFWRGYAGRVRRLVEEGGLATFNRFLLSLKALEDLYAPPPNYPANARLAHLDAITCRQWFDELGLPPVYHEIYDVTARGLFGANLDEVSALGAYEEIAYDFEDEAPLDRREVAALEADDSSSGAYTFPSGIAEFTDAVGGALGERARLGARVRRIEGDDREGYRVRYADASGREVTVAARSVIVATPTPITLEVASAVLDAEQRGLLARIPYAVYATVALFSREPIFDRAFDLALPGDFFFTDLYDSTWVQRRAGGEGAGRTGYVVSCYVAPTGYRDRGLLELTDEEILARCLTDLERLFPGAAARVTGHDILRHPYAYPVNTPGQFGRLQRLHRTLTGGLQLAGDGVVYPHFEAAVASGEIAAERVGRFLS